MYVFTKLQEELINREALRLRVRPVVIKMVIIARKVSVSEATKIVEREINKIRSNNFDF